MHSRGKGTLAEFDNQLAALRQRISVPLRLDDLPSTIPAPSASASTSTGTVGAKGISMLYAGNFCAQQQQPFQPPLSSSSACVVDPASMLETIRYLKRASRDRLEEFADMEELFHYDAEEEERRVTAKHIAQGATLRWDAPLNEPFTFEFEQPRGSSQKQLPSHKNASSSRGPTPQQQQQTALPASASSSIRGFDALYDPKRALGAASKPMGGAVVVGPAELTSSTTSSMVVSAKTKPSSQSQSAYASRIPAGSTHSGSTLGGRRDGDVLSHVGTAVPYSSVSVKDHVQRGAAAALATTSSGDGSGSDLSSAPQRVLRPYRPACTAQLVDAVTVKFCPACAHCMAVSSVAPHPSTCDRCGCSMLPTYRMGGSDALPPGGASDDDAAAVSALREIEAMEQREALAFQAALAEWRGAAGNTIEETRGTASSTRGDAQTRDVALHLPRGHTYFSHLWLQMQDAVSA